MQIDSFHNFAPPPYISATDEVTGDQHDSLTFLAVCLLYFIFSFISHVRLLLGNSLSLTDRHFEFCTHMDHCTIVTLAEHKHRNSRIRITLHAFLKF